MVCFAVADDVAGLALGCRDELAVDDQQAVVMTFDVALDDDGTAVFLRLLERDLDFVRRLQVDGDAAAVVSVQRFQDHREADRPGRPHGILSAAHQALLGHGQAEVAQNAVRFLLVPGQLDRDVAGLAGRRRLDALLVAAMAELDQAVAIQPQPRDIAFFRGPHQRGCARPERAGLCVTDEAVAFRCKIPVGRRRVGGLYGVGQEAQQELEREFAGFPAHGLVLVLEHHVVETGLAVDGARAAIGHRRTGDVLQLDCHMLHDVPEPGALFLAHAPHEATGLPVGATVLVQIRAALAASVR